MQHLIKILVLIVLCQFSARGKADELSDRDAFWRTKVFTCTTATGQAFPSKEVVGQPQDCDDGDMTLFNGLLCASRGSSWM